MQGSRANPIATALPNVIDSGRKKDCGQWALEHRTQKWICTFGINPMHHFMEW